MNPIKNYFLSARHDVVIFSLVAATIILAIVYSVFSASTLSSTQLGVGTSTPGAALAVRGGLLVAGGDAQILGLVNMSSFKATSTSVNSGVGTSSPEALFSVGGIILSGSAGATSTNVGNEGIKQNLTVYGNFEVLGSCTGCLGTSGISGSGTTNRVAKFTSSTAIGNSLITDDGTNVGIATGTPGTALAVTGAGVFTGHIMATMFTATSTTATSSIAYGLTVGTSGGTLGVGTSTPGLGKEVGILGDIFQSSGATTTQTVHSSSGTQGGCIELEGVDGTWVRIYAGRGSSATTSAGITIGVGLVFEEGRCQ